MSWVRAAMAPKPVRLPSASKVGRRVRLTIGRVLMSQPNHGRREPPQAIFDMILRALRRPVEALVSVYGSRQRGAPKIISTTVSSV
jgi:hypothetical protein